MKNLHDAAADVFAALTRVTQLPRFTNDSGFEGRQDAAGNLDMRTVPRQARTERDEDRVVKLMEEVHDILHRDGSMINSIEESNLRIRLSEIAHDAELLYSMYSASFGGTA